MKQFALAAVVGLLPLVVACAPATSSNPQAGARATQPLTIKGLDLRFEPTTLTARAGQPIQITLDNGGQVQHDLTLTLTGAPQVQVLAQPGQKATSQPFTIDKPGSYAFVCMQPGHEAAGMKGTLIVQ